MDYSQGDDENPMESRKQPNQKKEENLNRTTEACFFLQSTLASFSKFHHFDEGLPGCTLIWGRHDLKVEGDFGGQTSNLTPTTTPPSKLLPGEN